MENLIDVQIRHVSTKYFADGYCWGRLWGGGEGGYEATQYEASNLETLREMINTGIKDGTIDGGMGFERMLGALMNIRQVSVIEIVGSEFFSGEYKRVSYLEQETFGELSDEAEECLSNAY